MASNRSGGELSPPFLPQLPESSPFCPGRFTSIFAELLQKSLQRHPNLETIPVFWDEHPADLSSEHQEKPYAEIDTHKLGHNGRRWIYTMTVTLFNPTKMDKSDVVGISSPSFLKALCETEIGGSYFRPTSAIVGLYDHADDPKWRLSGTVLVEESAVMEIRTNTAFTTTREIRRSKLKEIADSNSNPKDGKLLAALPLNEEEAGGIYWNTRTTPHMIIYGNTGSGKTTTASRLAQHALTLGHAVCWIDLIKNGASLKESLPQVEGQAHLITDTEEAVRYLEEVYQNHITRSQNGGQPDALPPEMIVLEEGFASLRTHRPTCGDYSEADKLRQELGKALSRVMRQGGKAANVLITSQQTDGSDIRTEIFANVSTIMLLSQLATHARVRIGFPADIPEAVRSETVRRTAEILEHGSKHSVVRQLPTSFDLGNKASA